MVVEQRDSEAGEVDKGKKDSMTQEKSVKEKEVGNKKSRDIAEKKKREQERETYETLTNGREFHIPLSYLTNN